MSIKKLKKICYISYKVLPGPNFEYLSKIMAQNGYDVSLISIHEKGFRKHEVIDKRKIYRISLTSPFYSKKSVLSFIYDATKVIYENQISLVHIHSSCVYFGLYKLWSKAPSRFIYHSLSYPLSDSQFQRIKQMFFINFQCLLMDKVIFQSQEAIDHWSGRWMLRNTAIVPVGFDQNALHAVSEERRIQMREKLGIDKDEILIVFCGSISKFRNLDKLIRAFAAVSGQIDRVRLLMIGDGNSLQECKDLVDSMKIAEAVTFTGRAPHSELVNYLGASDIGVSYIPINENYSYNPPVKTFDYLACGLPTVATRTISNSNIILNGYNGILAGDSEKDVAGAIIYLIKNEGLRWQIRKKARESILLYNFKNVANKYLIPVYEEVFKCQKN